MISTRLLRFLNRALQFLSDLQQSFYSKMQMNFLLIFSLSTWLMSIQKAKCLSVCLSVCGWEYTERWRLATATPAIRYAHASVELKCASRSHAGLATLSPPKQNPVICNKRIICLFSPSFQNDPLHRKSVVSPFMDITPCGLPWKCVLALLCQGIPLLINWVGLREKNVMMKWCHDENDEMTILW